MQKYDPRDLAVKIAKIDNHFTGDTDDLFIRCRQAFPLAPWHCCGTSVFQPV
ncbi:hypothetical protein [Acidovorax temperans]|uniref:hypothetical protein n=1 Tax=Acidovorax temperans TaxID=80878 RepID=UPI001476AF7B|nr:hypothetical protein [Acidovorax temperans]